MPLRANAVPASCHKITIQLDPDDDQSTVELTLVDKLTTEENTGPMFRRRITTFNNVQDWDGADSSRTEAVRKITHKQRLPGMDWQGPGAPLNQNTDVDDPDDDGGPSLQIYVPTEVILEDGSGPGFVRRIHALEPIEWLKFRKGHIRRIKNEDDEDIWIDVWRKDQFIQIEASGPTYQIRFVSVLWEDPNPATLDDFDDNDLVALPAPQDAKNAVYRLDFLQEIVNIGVGKPVLIITLKCIYVNAVQSVGRVFFPVDMEVAEPGTSGAEISQFTLHTPAVPLVPAIVGPPPVPAKPAISAFAWGFTAQNSNGFNSSVSYDGTVIPPVDPFSKDMFTHQLMWIMDAGRVLNDDEAWQTFFINLGKYKQGHQTKAIFTIDVPAVPVPVDRAHLFEYTVHVHNPVSGFEGDETFQHIGSDFFPLADQLSAARVEAAGTVQTLIAAFGEAYLVGDVIDQGKNDPASIDLTQGDLQWEITARIYGGKKHFPFKDTGEPDMTQKDWSGHKPPPDGPMLSVATAEKTQDGGGGPTVKQKVTITCNFPPPAVPGGPAPPPPLEIKLEDA